jgi:hypothetical protein
MKRYARIRNNEKILRVSYPFNIKTATKKDIYKFLSEESGLTIEQVKKWHPAVHELGPTFYLFRVIADTEISDLDEHIENEKQIEKLQDLINDILLSHYHSRHRHKILKMFAEKGTAHVCACAKCYLDRKKYNL